MHLVSLFSLALVVLLGADVHAVKHLASYMSSFASVQIDGRPFAWGLRKPTGVVQTFSPATLVQTPSLVPNVVSASRIKSVCMGREHSCYLREDGTISCVGEGTVGQMGISTTTPAAGIKDVICGGFHSCVLTTAGGLRCSGKNSLRQLGYSSSADQTMPVDFATYGSAGVLDAAAGDSFTCIIESATGAVLCVGNNEYGQFGYGSATSNTYFASTPVASSITSGAVKISTGHTHVCIVTNLGGLRCWGDNRAGQIGIGSISNTKVANPATPIGLDFGIVDVVLGASTSCAIDMYRKVKCFGANISGQFGIGAQSPAESTPIYLGSPAVVDVLEVAVASSTICYSDVEAKVRCAGSNQNAQLGIGGATGLASSVPILYFDYTAVMATTGLPTMLVTKMPSIHAPTRLPSASPTATMTSAPTRLPSASPTAAVTSAPSSKAPTRLPSASPTAAMTSAPSSKTPSRSPSTRPSTAPSRSPSTRPSTAPSRSPSARPSASPSVQPTALPSAAPTTPTMSPSFAPSSSPTLPMGSPTASPTMPTGSPSASPTISDSFAPTFSPTAQLGMDNNVNSNANEAGIIAGSFFGALFLLILLALLIMLALKKRRSNQGAAAAAKKEELANTTAGPVNTSAV